MSNRKKWKFTPKQLRKGAHSRRYRFHVCTGKKGKARFSYFRHQKWFKELDGKISMSKASSKDIWYWD